MSFFFFFSACNYFRAVALVVRRSCGRFTRLIAMHPFPPPGGAGARRKLPAVSLLFLLLESLSADAFISDVFWIPADACFVAA